MALKITAFIYDLLMSPLEKLGLQRLRRKILNLVSGDKILEIGAGTGLNIPVYPDGKEIVCIEPKFGMIKKAIKRAEKHEKKVYFVCSEVETLPFKSETFDVVFATFVFCEVKDPEGGFNEILRVLKSGGKLILLEHVRPNGKIISKVFDIGNKITSILGENINRQTVELAVKSGFSIEKVEDIYDGIVKLIVGVKRAKV
ncbi:MAG: class I SAM-dependent methyltransferase [Candidatus Kryptonium sp.]|nr:class I SAM-dependent methyltransferase [Candidatus Kryptonium sp.]